MSEHSQSRRSFLKFAGLGTAAMTLSSCTSLPSLSDPKSPFTFVQICDPQLGMGGYEQDVERFEMAVAQVNAMNPDFAVICGDLVHHANDRSLADFNRIKGRLTVPCFCVPGNHDIGNQPTMESLGNYRQMVGGDFYSFHHKGHAFVFVNTQLWKTPTEGATEKQDLWLERTLEIMARKRMPIFVVGHYPLFLKEPDEAEEYMNLPPDTRMDLLGRFEGSGVKAVLGGHTHRLLLNQYRGIQCVNAESTSKNFDKRPFGFRLWHVTGPGSFTHEFVPLKTAERGL